MGKKTLLPLHLHCCANFFSLAQTEKSGWFSLLASVVREDATWHGWFFLFVAFSQTLLGGPHNRVAFFWTIFKL
jgi:hypothetical protein